MNFLVTLGLTSSYQFCSSIAKNFSQLVRYLIEPCHCSAVLITVTLLSCVFTRQVVLWQSVYSGSTWVQRDHLQESTASAYTHKWFKSKQFSGHCANHCYHFRWWRTVTHSTTQCLRVANHRHFSILLLLQSQNNDRKMWTAADVCK